MRWRYDREALRRLRLERQLKVAEIAETAGITRQNVASIERGHTEPKVTTLALLATALDVPLTEFFVDEDAAA